MILIIIRKYQTLIIINNIFFPTACNYFMLYVLSCSSQAPDGTRRYIFTPFHRFFYGRISTYVSYQSSE